ncbi:uncharacterized protein [Zea mays]|uniref:uncharacterized protein n=1 Tax=Zea mays TaxID=4577 RepID=UPI0004DEAC8E|nr:uncharacterized protein LOC111590576 [Zea mays]|eukprot:XP_023157151.1 uncharacterized protein LOC111590576 [Zea mays]
MSRLQIDLHLHISTSAQVPSSNGNFRTRFITSGGNVLAIHHEVEEEYVVRWMLGKQGTDQSPAPGFCLDLLAGALPMHLPFSYGADAEEELTERGEADVVPEAGTKMGRSRRVRRLSGRFPSDVWTK